MNDVLCLF